MEEIMNHELVATLDEKNLGGAHEHFVFPNKRKPMDRMSAEVCGGVWANPGVLSNGDTITITVRKGGSEG
jgi:hypothetical protein